MSFVTSIRDYVELVNNVYDSVSGDLTFIKVGQQTLSYLFQSIFYIFYYFLSFQWFRDFVHLPFIVPQISTTVLQGNLFFHIPNEKVLSFYDGVFSFVQPPSFHTNTFFIGFFNSFFLCLPVSCSHFIVFRRLLIQGIPAGIATALGSILGQCFFFGTIFFGIRFFVIPWLSFDSLHYILGLCLILGSVYSMSHEVQLTRVKISSTKQLGRFFALNFALAWTEQSCLFQYLGNITLTAQPTLLETFSGKNQFDFFVTNLSYLFGILVGSVLFSFLFCFVVYRLTFFVIRKTGLLYSESVEKLNFIFLTSIIALSLTSVPFYTWDYIVANPLGFVSQDTVFQKAIVQSIPAHFLFGTQPDSAPSKLFEPDIDIAPFDRAEYIKTSLSSRDNTDNIKNTFEDLNYQGELAWKSFQERVSDRNSEDDPFMRWLNEWKKKVFFSKNEEQKKQENSSNFDTPDEFAEPLTDESEALLFQFSDQNFARRLPELLVDPQQVELEKDIKTKYYSNPLYKNLLSSDIDFFVSREPSSFSLTAEDEKNLFEKRLLLADYYDSLRLYKGISMVEDFAENDDFSVSKSYADRIYNQQFKGTLHIVNRLFHISLTNALGDLDKKENETLNTRVLKFDKPLYTESEPQKQVFHEEIPYTTFEQDHENKQSSFSPFLESTKIQPFYAGWDNDQKKFVLTNRFIPRSLAGYETKSLDKNTKKALLNKNDYVLPQKSIEFTAWPVSTPIFENENTKVDQNIPYTFFFQSDDTTVKKLLKEIEKASETEAQTTGPEAETQIEEDVQSFPLNVSMEPIFSSLFESVSPKRGGFIWPGGSSFKINWSNLYDKKGN